MLLISDWRIFSLSRNVLVGKNNSVKISDFGLSRALAKDDSYYKLSQTLKMPVKWMALESLLYQKFSTYSDGNRQAGRQAGGRTNGQLYMTTEQMLSIVGRA